MEEGAAARRQAGRWRVVAVFLAVTCVALAVALVFLASQTPEEQVPVCGAQFSPNLIDLSEPEVPGPFHDLTKHEMRQLRSFLENDVTIRATPTPESSSVKDSILYTMDLFLPKKASVLQYLDGGAPQPVRQARVIMFRGDLDPPVVQEYVCGPLPGVKDCQMLQSDRRRNPVEFSLRPISLSEFMALYQTLMAEVEQKVGYILQETYGTSYLNCEPGKCFNFYPSPVATNLTGDINSRQTWIWADFPLEYYILHPVDFGYLAETSGSDPGNFQVLKVWYHGHMYDTLEQLVQHYNSTHPSQRYKFRPRGNTKYSSQKREGEAPQGPQRRPPTLVEPDGKRYSLKDRKVEYKDWSFNFRSSALTGPSLFDVRFKGQRIVYELGVSEIAVFYSANNPLHMTVDFVDSGALIGTHSKSLVPGADCPETATFVNQSFCGESVSDPVELDRAWCLFENNNGHPLRRHLSYSVGEGAFYGGLMDNVMVLRSILTIVNYDYVLDYIFHQNGVIETRVMSTGYIFPSFYTSAEDPYGFQIEDRLVGNIHHHMFHFKADIDISGTSNRYETLDILPDKTKMALNSQEYRQTKFKRSLKSTEKEALYKFDFNHPKYHVFHNNEKKTKYNQIKAYRLAMSGMSAQLLPEDYGSEGTIPWARHQMVVTRHKDEEVVSSSPYAMYDSLNPVTDFTHFYEDDENIEDEDLVVWVTLGMHHIPHTEDLPVTPTPGNHLTFFLLPYNYFDRCPSMSSTDQIHIQHKDKASPSEGVTVDRNGNSQDQCVLPQFSKEYDQLLHDDPDVVVESRKSKGIL